MTQYNLGRVTPIFQGDYDPKKSYECLDVVLFNGSSYVAKTDTLGNEPSMDSKFWQMVASAGTGGGGGTCTVDSELSLTSKNPVQNKVITLKINDLESIIVPEETVRQIVEGYQYMNQSQVETAIVSKGYQNAEQVETAIASKNYVPKMGFATINGAKITEGGNLIVSGGAGSTVDAAMSLESENPVQNKVVTKRINEVEAKIKPVPTKVSELTNDSGFQTKSQVDSNISGRGFQTANEVNTIIESKGYTTEAAVNAKGYQTKSEVDKNITDRKYTTLNEVAQQGYVKVDSIPHKVSQLENDAQYVKLENIKTINNQPIVAEGGGNLVIEGGSGVTVDQVNQIIDGKDLATNARVNGVEGKIPTDNKTLTNGAGYQTSANVESILAQKQYLTESQLNGKGYQTESQVNSLIEAKGYTTLESVAQQGYALNSDIPTNNNQLDNGANYTTLEIVNQQGFAKTSELPEPITVDENLSDSSTNPLQNKTVTSKLNTLKEEVDTKTTMTEVNQQGFAKTTDVDTKLSKKADSTRVDEVSASIPTNTEEWSFTLDDGSVVKKSVYIDII